MADPTIDFYTVFASLESVGLTLAQTIAKSQVLKDFVYIIFIWGMFETFFRVYEKREFLPFVNFIAYFAIMMAIFSYIPPAPAFSYINFPAQIADGFTSGIMSAISQQSTKDAMNKSLADVNKKFMMDTQGNQNKLAPDANAPQQYKDLYNTIRENLRNYSKYCSRTGASGTNSMSMSLINPSAINNDEENWMTSQNCPIAKSTTGYYSFVTAPDKNGVKYVTCDQMNTILRADMKDYIENYWAQTPYGKQVYQGSQASSDLSQRDLDTAYFLGGGSLDSIAFATTPGNIDSGTTDANEGGINYTLRTTYNFILNTFGSAETKLMHISVMTYGPMMIYGMYMLNAAFYALIIAFTPIVFVLAMQKPENITIYIKWIFTVIWAKSWQIVGYIAINLFNNIKFSANPGTTGVFSSAGVLNDLWQITLISIFTISPGIMALIFLEGRSMITGAMTGIAGNMSSERLIQSTARIGSVFSNNGSNTTSGTTGGSPIGGGNNGGGGGGNANANVDSGATGATKS